MRFTSRASLGCALVFFSVLSCHTDKPATDSRSDATAGQKSASPGFRQLNDTYFRAAGGCVSSTCHGGEKGAANLSFADARAADA